MGERVGQWRVVDHSEVPDFLGVYVDGVFFFQAEDGIRDYKVTGVQTCALPIFSYSASDSSVATELASILERHGLRTWFGPARILGAQQWHDEIGAALNRCDWFVQIGRASCRERV